jgi:hypothetical protein
MQRNKFGKWKKMRKETKRKDQQIFSKGCLHGVKNPRASPI